MTYDQRAKLPKTEGNRELQTMDNTFHIQQYSTQYVTTNPVTSANDVKPPQVEVSYTNSLPNINNSMQSLPAAPAPPPAGTDSQTNPTSGTYTPPLGKLAVHLLRLHPSLFSLNFMGFSGKGEGEGGGEADGDEQLYREVFLSF